MILPHSRVPYSVGTHRLGWFLAVCLLMPVMLLPLTTQASTERTLGVRDCARSADMPPALKMEQYRGPTPACVPQGITVTAAEVAQLIQHSQPVLIDVLSIVRRVDEGFGSTWLPEEPHQSLPGAVWLPRVGYGSLEPDLEPYFKQNLERLSQGDKTKAIVLFCVADCWMSWNAVQRVSDYGYTQVYWFKDGVDGWKEAGFKLVPVEPVPVEDND